MRVILTASVFGLHARLQRWADYVRRVCGWPQAKALTLCPYLDSAAGQCPLHSCAYAHSEAEIAERKAAKAASRRQHRQPLQQAALDAVAAATGSTSAGLRTDAVFSGADQSEEVGGSPGMHACQLMASCAAAKLDWALCLSISLLVLGRCSAMPACQTTQIRQHQLR